MTVGTQHVLDYLNAHGVDYELLHHERDVHATSTALHTHTPLEAFAKTVLLRIDGEPAMAVVPANASVALSKLQKALGARQVQLARESETLGLCPDCEEGAAPPLGGLYDLPVFVSSSLAARSEITFNGASHQDAIRMTFADFEKLARPRVLALTHRDRC